MKAYSPGAKGHTNLQSPKEIVRSRQLRAQKAAAPPKPAFTDDARVRIPLQAFSGVAEGLWNIPRPVCGILFRRVVKFATHFHKRRKRRLRRRREKQAAKKAAKALAKAAKAKAKAMEQQQQQLLRRCTCTWARGLDAVGFKSVRRTSGRGNGRRFGGRLLVLLLLNY